MINTAQGSLTIVGANTPAVQLFWRGKPIPNVTSLSTDWDHCEQRVKIKVTAMDPVLQCELLDAGLIVNKEQSHV
jgi:hypothetical protein